MKNIPTFDGFLNESSTTDNYQQYQELCKSYPHFKKILEDQMYTSPRYAISKIWDKGDSVVFYMHQSFGTTLSLWENMKKYRVSIQVPGNQEYTFSVSIDKK